jgi:UDP-N-acetylmuramate: L-alanyl-gamma-D-glutamyl-meso-diaminopimelate ligase
VETYSLLGEARWRGAAADLGAGRQRLTVRGEGSLVDQFTVPMTGRHNMENALAVIGAASRLGLSGEEIAGGLASFAGVRRRQEVRGRARGVTVIDDFAHHPTAIRETLAGLRRAGGDGRLFAAFEPRSATSRRRVFQEAFAGALGHADRVLLAPLYRPEKIPPEERLDLRRLAADLRAAGTDAALMQGVEEIVAALVSECRHGDTVVVMSSGGFDGLVERLLVRLGEGEAG